MQFFRKFFLRFFWKQGDCPKLCSLLPEIQMRFRNNHYICLCCRKIALHIAKVFFACPIGNLVNFLCYGAMVVNTPPVSMIMSSVGFCPFCAS